VQFNDVRTLRSATRLKLSLVAVAMCALTGMALYGSTAVASGKKLTVAMLPKLTKQPYFNVWEAGAKQAANQLGGKIVDSGPSTADASQQAQYVTTLTSQGVNAIVVSADDPNAIVPALKQAEAHGVTVVSSDSDANGGNSVFVNQATNAGVAQTLVSITHAKVRSGQIAIVSGLPTAAQQNAWVALMKKDLKKYPKLDLVKVAYGDTAVNTTTTVVDGLLQEYPKLKALIVPDSISLPTAAGILDQKGLKGKILLTGLSLPSQMKKYVANGTVPKFALWNVTNLGYLSYYAAYLLSEHKITNKPGTSFRAGKLGKFKINKQHVIVLGPPQIFTKQNINQFHF
jgi:rhamnose transport system substrate-binding protein